MPTHVGVPTVVGHFHSLDRLTGRQQSTEHSKTMAFQRIYNYRIKNEKKSTQ